MATVTVSASLYDSIGQIAHVEAGLLVVLGPNALFGPRFMWAWCLALVVFASVKEFWYDTNYETSDERGNGWEDFGFYMVGMAIGIVLWEIKVWYTREKRAARRRFEQLGSTLETVELD